MTNFVFNINIDVSEGLYALGVGTYFLIFLALKSRKRKISFDKIHIKPNEEIIVEGFKSESSDINVDLSKRSSRKA